MFVCLFLILERGIERNINWLPSICAPTGDQTYNLGCALTGDQICNFLVYRTMLQPTEPPGQGSHNLLTKTNLWVTGKCGSSNTWQTLENHRGHKTPGGGKWSTQRGPNSNAKVFTQDHLSTLKYGMGFRCTLTLSSNLIPFLPQVLVGPLHPLPVSRHL